MTTYQVHYYDRFNKAQDRLERTFETFAEANCAAHQIARYADCQDITIVVLTDSNEGDQS